LVDFAGRPITERYRDRDQGDAARLNVKWSTAILVISYPGTYYFRGSFYYVAGQFDMYV